MSGVQNQLLSAPDARVLVVDDTLTNLMVLKALLKKTQIQVTTAGSGKECIEKIKEQQFDLILLDHLMPEMNGIETLAGIKNLGEDWENIPVIALTANAIENAREFYLGEGFDDYLEKPVQADKMRELLNRFLPKEKIISE